MRLDVRDNRESDNEAVRFAFLLTFEKTACLTRALPWDWKNVEIEVTQSPSIMYDIRSFLRHR